MRTFSRNGVSPHISDKRIWQRAGCHPRATLVIDRSATYRGCYWVMWVGLFGQADYVLHDSIREARKDAADRLRRLRQFQRQRKELENGNCYSKETTAGEEVSPTVFHEFGEPAQVRRAEPKSVE